MRSAVITLVWRAIALSPLALTVTIGPISSATQAPAGQADAPFTVLSRDAQRPLATTVASGQQMVALDDLAAIFQLSIREDALAGGITVTYKGRTIVLTPGQPLASIGGRLVSLPTAPVRGSRGWLVPVEFTNRALAAIYDTRLELRKPSRLIIVGDIRIPRIVVTHEELGNQTRLIFDIAPSAAYTVSREPDRLFVKFDADRLDATLPTIATRDVVEAIHKVDQPSSIVIELGPKFASFRVSTLPTVPGSSRVVVEMASSETTTAPPLDLAPASGVRTIVIDPGHGGDESGARGPGGTLEKTVTLSVARRLKDAIERRLGLQVMLTREADETVNLDRRAAIANNNKADLFLSLHANRSTQPSVGGAEVYYLSLDDYEAEAGRPTNTGTQALPVFGGGTRDIEVMPWEMAQVRYITHSALLADFVIQQLRTRITMSPRPIQQAPLRALVGANMPAVLVEMGFLSNPEQERQLSSAGFQDAVAQALFESVVRFRDHVGGQQRRQAQ